MDALDRLRAQQETARLGADRLVNTVIVELALAQSDAIVLRKLKNQLNAKSEQLNDLDEKVSPFIVTRADLQKEEEDNEEYREKIIDALTDIDIKLDVLAPPAVVINPGAPNNGSVSSTNDWTVRLPKLVMKKFSGNPIEWSDFWSNFELSVNGNTSITTKAKFVYLNSVLEGTAAAVVRGLKISDENYAAAVTLLQNRFGRKEVIVNAHLQMLMKLEPVKRLNDLDKLRKLYDTCEMHVRNLENEGIETTTFGVMLCPLLRAAIPDVIALDFSRKNSNNTHDLKLFLEFWREELEIREQNAADNARFATKEVEKNVAKTYGDTKKTTRFEKPASSSALMTNTSDSTCIFCSETSHKKEDCPLSIADRLKRCQQARRCFKCLANKHMARNCPQKEKCVQCERFHHILLCEGPTEKAENVLASTVTTANTDIFLQVLMANVESNHKTKTVHCFFDGGSHRSFISSKLVKEIGAQVVGEQLISITGFGETVAKPESRRRVKITLRNTQINDNSFDLELIEVPWISNSLAKQSGVHVREKLKQNNIVLNIDQLSIQPNEVSILIGADNFWRIVTGETRRLDENLMCLHTGLGWTMHGAIRSEETITKQPTIQVHLARYEDRLDNMLKRFWELEDLGIPHETLTDHQDEDDQAVTAFKKSIKWTGDRYEVRLPWLMPKSELDSNYQIALKRLWNLVRKFRKDPELYYRYKKVLDDQMAEGIIETAPEVSDQSGCYYLPHSPVIRERRSTTKLRIVYDASSHAQKSRSLNDCLFTGPNLLPELINALLFFRQLIVALISDIKQAFHQILLHLDDRDAVRFLWIAADWDLVSPIKVEILRQTRVLFGASPSPYLLNGTIQHHLEKYATKYAELIARLLKRFYVDDYLDSVSTDQEAIETYKKVSEIMCEASMDLVKWNSNSKLLREQFKIDHPETELETEVKVLGLKWNCELDELALDLEEVKTTLERELITKRRVIQLVAQVFDPLGFASPFTVTGKMFFQQLWKHKMEWDDRLPKELIPQWENWKSQLPELERVRVPRHYGIDPNASEIELHLFCDASPLAYGIVAYTRVRQCNSLINTFFVLSKCRIAPIKTLTLPRLELMGALLLARVAGRMKQFTTAKVTAWTDSTIVLCWLGERKKAIPFVARRVEEIKQHVPFANWRHCPGVQNPADLLTRGIDAKSLLESKTWWNGPEWLTMDEHEWPSVPTTQADDFEMELEETLAATVIVPQTWLIDVPTRYGSWRRLLRVTSWVNRFLNNCKSAVRDGSPLTTDEINNSERYWLQTMQQQSYSKELLAIKNQQSFERDSILRNVTCFMDSEQTMRLNTRIQWAGTKKNLKNPIVLHPNHPLTKLIILAAHQRVFHGGLGETLAELRQCFWTPKLRKTVKSELNRCFVCKRVQGRLVQQVEAALPPDRITQAAPFQVVGIDFAGPLYQQSGEKCYIVVITCAVIRAVHLELVTSMNTERFILALKRFFARRGIPTKIYSDNALTFKRTEKELCALLSSIRKEQFQGFLTDRKIEWSFIVERAPWWGGFWERMVKSTKMSLKKVLGQTTLDFEELTTILSEVESCINSRPITYVYTENEDEQPLSPSHFLTGGRSCNLPDPNQKLDEKLSSSTVTLLKRWKQRQQKISHLWSRWNHEYLTELREYNKTKASREVQKGDIVVIEELNQPRMTWKIGRIREVFIGRDGRVRACEIQLPFNKVLRRPVQRLCILEAQDGIEASEELTPAPV